MADSAQRRGLHWRATLTLVFLLVLFAVSTQSHAQTFKVLHTFHSGKGPQFPSGRLILDAQGNLYGIAQGGKGTCWSNNPCGTVFKMNKSGKLIWVYSFKDNADGFGPIAGLLRDAAGNFYGTTVEGGKQTQACGGTQNPGCGLAYKLDSTGTKETVLHRFTGGADGQTPEALLIHDSAGNLYGTTLWGGNVNDGVVFKLDQAGKYRVLYTFQGIGDGGADRPGLIWGTPGNLYGTNGVVLFAVNAATGKETLLYNFSGGSDGSGIFSLLIEDAAGDLYGTTSAGGNEQVYDCNGYEGCGVVYELSPNGNGGWTETVLHEFCAQSNCTDGWFPLDGVLRDAGGNLYGTTYRGGISPHDCCGVVFKLDTAGSVTVLHTFTGGADGAYPSGGLVMDATGSLYGTAGSGGDLNCQPKYGGCGVVFEITP